MKHNSIHALLFCIFLLLIQISIGVAYEENIAEGIFLVRPQNQYLLDTNPPSYLVDEDIVFFGCSEQTETPLRLSIICEDTNEFKDVMSHRWGPQHCYMGGASLSDLSCTRAIVQAEYVEGGENVILSQRIQLHPFSETINAIVNTQFADGGWQNALDTAHALLVLNNYPELFERQIEEGIEFLKNSRNEEDKCWPKERCQISTTANILFLLEKAGFEDLRIQHDALLYLQREQHFITEQEEWTIRIRDHQLNVNNILNTTCVYEYSEQIQTISLERYPQERFFDIRPAYNSMIRLVCTQPVHVRITDMFSQEILQFQGDNFTYEIPGPCWTRDSERIRCDLRTTLHAASAGIQQNRLTALNTLLSAKIRLDRTAGTFIGEQSNTINNALYALLQTPNRQDIITGLLYYQRNDGGWNAESLYYGDTFYEPTAGERIQRIERITDSVTHQIVHTGYAVMALLANDISRNAEPIIDAQRWMSQHEQLTGIEINEERLSEEDYLREIERKTSSILTDPKRNAFAHYVLKQHARPFLRTNPPILIVNQKEMHIDLINPTIFNLEGLSYELSPSLQGLIEIEERDFVRGFSFRRVPIELLRADTEAFGYLRVKKGSDEYLKLPIIVTKPPSLTITLPEEVVLFGTSATLPFSIERSNHEFSCSIEWETEGITSAQQFNINAVQETFNYPVRFSQAANENKIYEATITCIAADVTFIIPVATQIIRYTNNPLFIEPRAILINTSGKHHEITIRNQLEEQIFVTAELRERDPFIVLSTNMLSIPAGEEQILRVQAVPPLEENYTSANNILFSVFGTEERVSLTIDIIATPPRSPILLYIVLVITVLLLGASGYLGYRYRTPILAWYEKTFRKESIQQRVLHEVEEIEQEEEEEAIRNMIQILKLQGKKDTEIYAELEEEGFSKQDIANAIAKKKQATQKKQEAPKG